MVNRIVERIQKLGGCFVEPDRIPKGRSGQLMLRVLFCVPEVEWAVHKGVNEIHSPLRALHYCTHYQPLVDLLFLGAQIKSLIAGVLNHQVAHHLFPGIIQSHYPHITPIIRQTCEEFGVKYNHMESAQRAIGYHFNHLRRLGQPNAVLHVHICTKTELCWSDEAIVNTVT